VLTMVEGHDDGRTLDSVLTANDWQRIPRPT
jgi:hypothetical protein